MSKIYCQKHASYDPNCSKCIPPPPAPFMRIGDKGETVDPGTGLRYPPGVKPSLPQIKKVEKWETRDGTFHDSPEDAERYQLMLELKIALGVHEKREDQARHLLLHFDIVRKGDTPKVIYGPTIVKKVLHFWSFFIGAAIATSVMLYLFR